VSRTAQFPWSSRTAAVIGVFACATAALFSAPLATAAPAVAPLPAAAAAGSVEDGLQQVLTDALAANLELRAGNASVAQRLAALDQARARYLPALDFAAR
jgi:outer membrane protein TolC